MGFIYLCNFGKAIKLSTASYNFQIHYQSKQYLTIACTKTSNIKLKN